MAMPKHGQSDYTQPSSGEPSLHTGKQVYHVRKKEANPDLFTDSAFVHMRRTLWARLTSRTAVETYRGTLDHFVALVILTVQTMATIVMAAARQAWALSLQLFAVGAQVGGGVGRAVGKHTRSAGSAVAGGARATGGAFAGGARAMLGAVTGGARATRKVVAGGARATRSAVGGGARATKGVVAGGARVTRKAVVGRERGGKRVAKGGAKRVAGERRPGVPKSARARPPTKGVASRRKPGAAREGQPAPRPTPRAPAAPPGQLDQKESRLVSDTVGSPVRPTRPVSPKQPQATRDGVAAGARPQRGAAKGKSAARDAKPGQPVRKRRVARHRVPPERAAAAGAVRKTEAAVVERPRPATRGKKRRAPARTGVLTRARRAAGLLLSLARAAAVLAWRVPVGLWSCFRALFRLVAHPLRWMAGRWQYTAVPVVVALIALMLTPIGWDMLDGLTGNASSSTRSSESDPSVLELPPPEVAASSEPALKPKLPKISLPRLSGPLVTVPQISFDLPAFLSGPVNKVDKLLAGALVEPRSRVLIADVADQIDGDEELGRALAIVLEAELSRGSYFSVPARERALMLAGGGRAGDFAIGSVQALSLAGATGSAAVITGELTQGDSLRSLLFRVNAAAGDELFVLTVDVNDAGLLEAVGVAARELARELGDRAFGGEEDQTGSFLTRSLPAAHAYVRARAHSYRAEYRQTIAAAKEATQHDPAFASAYQLLAEAYALNGQRVRAAETLEIAWQFRDRLSLRERLRLTADREAFAGRHSEAILAYDYLFSQFRDDAAALKSQAILQKMIGSRGGGAGNLRVAYWIDPVDWPPLERVAAFLGYRGRLPEFAELAAANSTTTR